MSAFASQVTVAVRAAQQYTQLARWAAQLQSIQQLGTRLNRLTTVPEIASAIAVELRVLIEYDNIRVYRLEGEDLNAVALHATDEVYLDETPERRAQPSGRGHHGLGRALTASPRTCRTPRSIRGPRTSPGPTSSTSPCCWHP